MECDLRADGWMLSGEILGGRRAVDDAGVWVFLLGAPRL